MSAAVAFSDAPAPVRGSHGALPALTDTDLRVLGLVADGRSNGEIAKEIHCSVSTVKDHLERLGAVLGAQNRGELVGQGYRQVALRGPDPAPDGRGLVTREQFGILVLFAAGAGNEQIADELDLTVEQVKSRVAKLLKPLGANSRENAIRRAVDLGVLTLVPRGSGR